VIHNNHWPLYDDFYRKTHIFPTHVVNAVVEGVTFWSL